MRLIALPYTVGTCAGLLLLGCDQSGPQRDEPLPPAVVPSTPHVTSPDSTRPIAEPPASPGSTASMSPSPYTGHAPRPSTSSAATVTPVPVTRKPSALPGTAEPPTARHRVPSTDSVRGPAPGRRGR
jgi:hypothetical protein